jgi:hypothetical protein
VKYNKNPASYIADQENEGEPMFDIGDDILYEGCENPNSSSVNKSHFDAGDLDQRSAKDGRVIDSESSSLSKPSMNPSSYGELSHSSFSGEILDGTALEEDLVCGAKQPVQPAGGAVEKCDRAEEAGNAGSTIKKAVSDFIAENEARIPRRSSVEQEFVNERILQDILNTELGSPNEKKSNAPTVTKDAEVVKKTKRKRMKRKDWMPDFGPRIKEMAPLVTCNARADIIETSEGRYIIDNGEIEYTVYVEEPEKPKCSPVPVCTVPEDDDEYCKYDCDHMMTLATIILRKLIHMIFSKFYRRDTTLANVSL